jgi:hypothetical protein
MSTSNQTHDHKIIQKWVEERKGVPTRVKGTGKKDDDGLLRIHFPENSKSDNFEEMEWEDFFADFDHNKLDFLYQDKKADGETSTFHKFVERK